MRKYSNWLCKRFVSHALDAIRQPSVPFYHIGVLWLMRQLVDNNWSSGFVLKNIPGKDYFDSLSVNIRESYKGKQEQFDCSIITSKNGIQNYHIQIGIAPETFAYVSIFYIELRKILENDQNKSEPFESAHGEDSNQILNFKNLECQKIVAEILGALIDFVQGDHTIQETPRHSYILEHK